MEIYQVHLYVTLQLTWHMVYTIKMTVMMIQVKIHHVLTHAGAPDTKFKALHCWYNMWIFLYESIVRHVQRTHILQCIPSDISDHTVRALTCECSC